ncbi:ABC transporter permease [Billgrantia tianxiuensis]|jgi:peptide/nickel transport system permease protein|uniref:ABC transporter permease n=1 Tax=Billgrantia tianxiuensis TaxID=2497861 RepID=A0A6I6SIV0_9GAMM|nr:MULTISPECIES: ABC transporter permease [Halomonas]MCE8034879.1 ABC transporter permease [Halomonas sp. MCCC 1A11057]QHC48586.1 ABC transporter permease [Halomonas tianxiuensis]
MSVTLASRTTPRWTAGLGSLLLQRLFQAGLVAWMVGTLTFVLTRSLPGDMAYRIAAGRYGHDMVNTSAAEAVRAELALDQPALGAYFGWLWDLLQLDLGRSLVSGEPVMTELWHQLGHSLGLAFLAVLLSLLLGPPLGLLAGLKPNGALDRVSEVAASVLRALPPFAVGLVLILIFSVTLGWLPAAGHGRFAHGILPALTLALALAAISSRVARNAMSDVSQSAYYAFSRTKGLGERLSFLRHGLRNAAVPVIAYLGVQFVYLIEGVVVVETLFAWPGIGHALVHAIVARDVPMIQGTALVMGLMFVALNTVVDLLCHWLDPRRRSA